MTIDSNDDVIITAHGQAASCSNCDIRITRIQGLGPSLAVNPIFEVTPELPDGLTMNWRDGTISGTPTVLHANTQHTVTVTAMGVTTTGTFTLEVITAPSITYPDSPFTLTKNTAVSGVTPVNTGGPIDTWSITGSLPNGLNFNSANGEITGTPISVTPTSVTVTITATNIAGSSVTTVEIFVQDEAPSSIDYPGSPYTFTKNDVVTGATPTYTGGAPTSWMITNGVIPNGLSVNPSTGEITGTPLDVTTSTVTLTIEASNAAGSITTTVDIDVQDVGAPPV